MKPMALLEVICLHEHDAKRAAAGGADRIELVGTMDDGGLAPSPELLARTLSAVHIPVRPMLRLDGGFRLIRVVVTRYCVWPVLTAIWELTVRCWGFLTKPPESTSRLSSS